MSDFIRVFLFFFSLTYWRNWTPSPAPFVLFTLPLASMEVQKAYGKRGFWVLCCPRSHQSSLVTGQSIGLDGGIMHHSPYRQILAAQQAQWVRIRARKRISPDKTIPPIFRDRKSTRLNSSH